ncbi:hypothetical protein GCM10010124_24830 [Pilimelia terevasa]|uniref:Acyl-CoA carboxylase subunit epsilon n=1 Tax=Pilimelia terevasa TaxID=53372 RepID=A0A8J3BLJ0_9ACTN|nr:acyl-CoA carboxylase epsilon subunit [Pilimelia terevasa]GGK31028.1 hypothetical protein GCM10010124_24830 [Pilimelia terevasa]
MTDAPRPAPDRSVRIVRGAPTDRELAALVGVLMTRGRPAAAPAPARSAWAAAGRPGAPRPGRGAWRRAALPR